MFVVSRNNLVTPVEMVGADKVNKTTRSASHIHTLLNTLIISMILL